MSGNRGVLLLHRAIANGMATDLESYGGANVSSRRKFRCADLTLCSGSDNYLVHIDIGRLLNGKCDGPGDRIR